jgi:DNA-binding NarL/FixJ family response regulator
MKAIAKILIVDDHAMFREGLRSILTLREDFQIVGEAEKGEEACGKALELEPDLVVMDISLPDMSGIDATRRIRELLPETRVVILSMHTKVAYIADAFKAGAAGYVTKGSSGSHLTECLRAVLAGDLYLAPSLSQDIVRKILAHEETGGECEDPAYAGLTPREQEIFRLMAEGFSTNNIAQRLFISRKTVENHRSNLFSKLGIHSTVELIRYAAKHEIIDLDLWKM